MKLAWMMKVPVAGLQPRGDGSSTLLTEIFPKSEFSSQITQPAKAPAQGVSIGGLWEGLKQGVKNMLPFANSTTTSGRQAFLLPEQKHWKEQVEAYAESPLEKSIFSLKKRMNEYIVSRAWADGIKSQDPLKREAALTLLKSYLSYTGIDSSSELSAHTQMKLLIFTPHMSEGMLGKAIIYEAILSLPVAQILEFSTALKKEFSLLSPMAQALILKQVMKRWKTKDKNLSEVETAALKKLVKELVIQFYTGQQEAMQEAFNQQEKIRLGFLKFQPVEEAYRKQLEEIERRYRSKLRQLKKLRSQKVAEAEEEKLRRIELIYDTIEGNLQAGLGDLGLELEELLAV